MYQEKTKLSRKPAEKLKPRKFGLWKGKVWISSDFDDEDEEINEMFYGGDPLDTKLPKRKLKI